MKKKYYIDTSIWIDLYEDRKGYRNEPLGTYALKLFNLIKKKKENIIISTRLINELLNYYSLEKVRGIIKPFENIIERINITVEQNAEGILIARERKIPLGDVLHAIIARDSNLILIARNSHFRKLKDISKYYKPEELI